MSELMSPEDRTLKVKAAQSKGWTKAEIAREIGLSDSNLGNLLKREAPHSKEARRLEEWLVMAEALDYELPRHAAQEAQAPYSAQPTAVTIMAARLHNLADTLLSPDFDADHKTEEFVLFVNRAHRSLDAYRAALKKSLEKD